LFTVINLLQIYSIEIFTNFYPAGNYIPNSAVVTLRNCIAIAW